MSYLKSYNALVAGAGVVLIDSTPAPGITKTTISSANTGLLNYGFFTSSTTQTNPVANAVNTVTLNTTGPSNGISLIGNSAITVANAGTYTKLFTLQLDKTTGGNNTVSIWLRLNGIDVAGSRQEVSVSESAKTTFVTGNYTLDITAGSNIKMCWSSSNTSVRILQLPTATTPTRPTGASVKITLTRIS